MSTLHPSEPSTFQRAEHSAPVTRSAWLPAVVLQLAALAAVPAVHGLLRRWAPPLAAQAAWGALALLTALSAGWLWWRLGRLRGQPGPGGAHRGAPPPATPRVADAPLTLTPRPDPAADPEAARLLLAQLSHELRTPLNAIIGFIGLVQDNLYKSAQERRDYLHNAHSSAVNLLEMINDVLEYSRLSAGYLTLAAGEVDPADLVESVAIFLAPQAHQKGLEIECAVGEGLPPLMRADVSRLRQILINLAANAIKFTVHGQVLVRVEPAPPSAGPPGRRALRLSVEDSGPGVSPEDQQRMFDSFVQLQEGARGGTGLGLAISRQLVTLMGGEIGVESVLGQGSCFHVTLPLEPGNGQQLAPVDTPLAGQRLLLLAPNPVVAAAQAARLRRLGATVTLAHHAEAGLAQLAAAPAGALPHAALLDDGIDATHLAALGDALRKVGGASAPALVFLSSTGRPLPEAVRRAGRVAILAKPLVTEQVRAVLGQLAATGTLAPEATPADAALLPDPSGRREVLVVEDNVINQKLIQALLHKAGYGVTLADNGREAVERLARHHYDLVLMDIQMPVLDGVSATREIRRAQGARAVPIVAMTANTVDESRQIADTAFDDYLTKPIDPRELTRILGQWIVTPSHGARPLGQALPRGQTPHLAAEHLGDLAAYAHAHDFAHFEQLLRLFLRLLDEHMASLSAAVANGDWPAVAAAADELRTLGGGFGAPRLVELAGDMATLGGEGLRVLIRDLEPQLAGECRLLHKELQGRLANEARRRS